MDPYDSIFKNLDKLLLAVVFLPLLGSLLVSLASYAGLNAVRRVASYTAAVQLFAAVALAFLVGSALMGQSGSSGKSFPMAVPGDPGHGVGRETATGETAWTLLAITPPGERTTRPTGVQFYMGLDGLNLPLVALASLMFFLAVLVSWNAATDRPAAYYAWLFALQTGVTGAFVSMDIILFYVFFELTLIPAFFLIGRWGVGSGRRDAARKFFLYTLLGSLFTLVGIVGVVLANPTPVNPHIEKNSAAFDPLVADPANPLLAKSPRPGPLTFSLPQLMANHSTWALSSVMAVQYADARLAQASPAEKEAARAALAEAKEKRSRFSSLEVWLFLALMAGFAVKIPLVPFHTWLPATYAEAPLAVTMVFAAVLSKLGTFGILRVVLPMTPEAAVAWGLPCVGVLAATSIGYAAFCAYAQRDMKLLAAYSSVSHLGLLVLGLFSLTPEGLSGALLHMVNHGLTAGALFALLAYFAERYRTTDSNAFGGLWKKHPTFTFFFVALSLASIGLPGLNNFVSEMLILAGLFDPRNVKFASYGLAVAGAAGIFLSAWYTFTMIRRVFFGPLLEPQAATPGLKLTGRETATFGILLAACLALGVMPQPLLDVSRGEIDRLVDVTDAARMRVDPTALPRAKDEPKRPSGPLMAQPVGGGGPPPPPRPNAPRGNPG